ncbi:MAG: hypothetical protein IJS40_00915 [Synergistaceae bacterium]|nr:hypothetical protein [Synergistaceae bacterium]
MITERIKLSNSGAGMNEVLALSDSVAASLGLSKKKSFHLRLLAEELLSMVRAIAGDFSAEFWIEEDNRICKLHLEAERTTLDYARRKELLSVSTKGENVARRGIMEKIRDLIEAGLSGMEESYKLQADYGVGMFNYGALGILDTGMSETLYAWSMQKYKNELESRDNENEDEAEARDELEKSIIANIADDVRVGVRKNSFELIIEKNFN